MNTEDYLNRLLPYRLDSLAIMVVMLERSQFWGEPKKMEILVEGQLQFQGLTTMFTNPIIEIGALQCRALLEFLGLKAADGILTALKPSQRKKDDAGIEFIQGPAGPLSLVTPSEAVAIHPEDPVSAGEALGQIITAANKGVAHTSATYFEAPIEPKTALLAGQLTQRLVEAFVYDAVGRRRPPIPVKRLSRSGRSPAR